jgi:ABC-type oligopeptide transport system ATPase subunit
MRAAQIIEEPLLICGHYNAAARRELALDMMIRVGLSPEWADRRPHQFSGGQRQRLAIARALVLKPKLLILDEALAGLDLSTQAQIVNLLSEIQHAEGLTLLYISHDLLLTSQIADEMAVMSQGRIVERATPAELFASPQHPETRKLLGDISGIRQGFSAHA